MIFLALWLLSGLVIAGFDYAATMQSYSCIRDQIRGYATRGALALIFLGPFALPIAWLDNKYSLFRNGWAFPGWRVK
jgi:hypothetical protein